MTTAVARRSLALFAACALTLPGAPARAVAPPSTITAAALHYFPGDTTYAAPLRVQQGAALYFAPVDPLGNHSVTAVQTDQNGPIFDSGSIIGIGQVAEVAGVPALAPGIYEFTCSVHEYMHGTLEVVPATT